MSFSFILLLITALIFDFLNGFHDSANIVATPIASRAMPPQRVLWLAAAAHFVGPFLFGVAVAETIGKGLTDPVHVTMPVVIAAMLAAVIWNVVTWYLGIPASSSHALVGGVVGAVMVASGFDAIQTSGLTTVLVALFLSPILGLAIGYLLMKLTLFLTRGATPRINTFFKRAQVVTAVGLALSHGANDAQKTMGIITLGLVVEGMITEFAVPVWVIALSAGAISMGTAMGGWRLIRTLGGRIYKIRPVDGFVSQISGAAIILGAALMGGPVSTTQVMSSSIMGAGSAQRFTKVRWQVGYEMLIAWVLTIPVSGLLAALFLFSLERYFVGQFLKIDPPFVEAIGMEWLKRFIKPKQSNFLQLLIRQGEFTVVSVEALQAYLKKPNEKRTVQARQVEKDADEVYRILIHELEDSFVTPLDREDIFALGRALDNFIDYVYDTIEEMEIFKLAPFADVSEIATLLLEMAKELHLTMERLLDHPRIANEHARRVKRLENEVEDAYRHSLANLFQGPEDTEHIMRMLKCREVLRHLSNAADQGDKAADIVMDIGVKWS